MANSEAKYVSRSQTFLSLGRTYDVHAVSVYDGVVFVLVVDDVETPSFQVRARFETVDSSIPSDWIGNVFPDGPVQFVAGPPFIAADVDSYEAMIDQRKAQVEQLWQRIKSLRVAPEG